MEHIASTPACAVSASAAHEPMLVGGAGIERLPDFAQIQFVAEVRDFRRPLCRQSLSYSAELMVIDERRKSF